MAKDKDKLYIPEGAGNIYGNAPEGVEPYRDDLSEDNKVTLGDYLSELTAKNTYNIAAGSSEFTLTDDSTGNPTAMTSNAPGGDNVFYDDMLEDVKAYYLNQTAGGAPGADGGGTFPTATLDTILNKNSGIDGNTLLGSVKGAPWFGTPYYPGETNEAGESESQAKILKTATSEVLAHNRFHPGGKSPFIQGQEFSKKGWFSVQTEMGRYNDSDAPIPTLAELAKVGLALSLRATGEAGGDVVDPDSYGKDAAMNPINLVQTALGRVQPGNMSVKATVEGLSKSSFKSRTQLTSTELGGSAAEGIRRKGDKTDPLEADNIYSFGQLNNYLEPYGGAMPVSMILLAVITAIGLFIAGIILALFLELMTFIFTLGQSARMEQPGEVYPMGASKGSPAFGKGNFGFRVLQFMGVPKLFNGDAGFLKCMMIGTLRYFSRVLGASAGYYTIVSRAAIRDLSQISDAMADADFGSLSGAIESIFIIIEAFTTSTIYTFLNTMAKLGDIVIISGGLSGKGDMLFAPMSTEIDNEAANLSNLHMKNRMKYDEDNTLAWGFGRTPSKYLLPAAQNLTSTQGGFALPTLRNAVVQSGDVFPIQKQNWVTDDFGKEIQDPVVISRISQEIVQKVEQALDTTYMPFYFHDLRTNEIISFMAFIENITDSFTPEWTEVGGFGRMDNAMIYKRTGRKIGITFWVVSTGPDDFDEMWFAINRLIAMIYPQWSRGMQLEDAQGTTFTQPFSQVPTASPLVRMRLGELFHSNYSQQSLQRLFGAGTDSFELGPDALEAGKATAETTLEEANLHVKDTSGIMQSIQMRISKGPVDPLEAQLMAIAISATGMWIGDISAGFGPGEIVTVADGKYNIGESTLGIITKKKFQKANLLRSMGGCKVDNYWVKPVLQLEDDEPLPAEKQKKARKAMYAISLPEAFEGDAGLMAGIGMEAGQLLLVPHEALSLDIYANFLRIKARITDGTWGMPPMPPLPFPAPADPDKMKFQLAWTNFFGKEGNMIAKSFDAAAGKGMAGAITQFEIDHYNGGKIPWETEEGSRAPKYVKITLGFAPIHDIPLGLDSQGSMRAPAFVAGKVNEALFGQNPHLDSDAAIQMWKDAVRRAKAAPRRGAPLPEDEEPPGDPG